MFHFIKKEPFQCLLTFSYDSIIMIIIELIISSIKMNKKHKEGTWPWPLEFLRDTSANKFYYKNLNNVWHRPTHMKLTLEIWLSDVDVERGSSPLFRHDVLFLKNRPSIILCGNNPIEKAFYAQIRLVRISINIYSFLKNFKK